ncbi:hypothetical protein PAPYR_3517 [Paratrimastix pyriformis]|uniref:Uncharacterized protein n=1 Tax=Paratrimastix pyriformis TaxID=342808 RepID=A0ABQ8UMR2_9EUKA|nr:hypothetical protein PAPYR_3517 [Paratrimastix pyriformis]
MAPSSRSAAASPAPEVLLRDATVSEGPLFGPLLVTVAPDAAPALVAWTLQAGTLQAGTLQAGTLQAGTLQAGTLQAGTLQAGTLQAGTRTLQAGTLQATSPCSGYKGRCTCLCTGAPPFPNPKIAEEPP